MTTPAGRAAPASPRNPLEARLARIWEEVLPPSATPIGVDDDFFDLGGESLHAFAVIGRVLREFGVRAFAAGPVRVSQRRCDGRGHR